jgi:hypothetical protein
MDYSDFPREAQNRIFFLERTIFEAIGGTIGNLEIRGMDFDSVESLLAYLSEKWKEYEERYL